MTEYIEREGLINKICNEKCSSDYGHCQKVIHDDKIILCVCDFIRWQPAADVAPVRHGRWVCVDTENEQFFICNRCKRKEYWESKFCPNCGAKMDAEG